MRTTFWMTIVAIFIMGLGSHDPQPIAGSAHSVPVRHACHARLNTLLPGFSSVYRFRPRDSVLEAPILGLKLRTAGSSECLGFVWLWRFVAGLGFVWEFLCIYMSLNFFGAMRLSEVVWCLVIQWLSVTRPATRQDRMRRRNAFTRFTRFAASQPLLLFGIISPT